MGGALSIPPPRLRRAKRLPFPKGGARSARPVGRSFAARSARNRRSGSPMNKGALQAVRRCKATIVNCGTKQREVSPMGTELRRAQCAKQAKRKSNEQRRIASGSAARRLLRIVGTRESRKRACERPKARRAEVVSTRSEAQCADTEHRAAKGGTVRRCGTTIPNCGTRPKGVRSAGTPRRYEGGRRPTRPAQFGGRSP